MTVVSENLQKTTSTSPVEKCICCPRRVAAKNAWYFVGIRPAVDELPAKDSFGPLCKVCYEQLKAVVQLALRRPKEVVSV